MPSFVVTGASGGGKSTLINALQTLGMKTVPEIGREIVREQLARQGKAVPWDDKLAFRDLLFDRSIAAYDAHQPLLGANVIFDRSFVEAIAYSHSIRAPVPDHFIRDAELRRFADPVFVCPPWRDIFTNDTERRGGFDAALEDYDVNVAAYRSLGYDLKVLPLTSVEDRAHIVLEVMGAD